MLDQNSQSHALTWFATQIGGLRDEIPTANFSDTDFLYKANTLMNEIARIDLDVYLPSYQNIDNYAASQMLWHVKREAQKIAILMRRAALETTVQPKHNKLFEKILVSLQGLYISLLQLNKELNSDYYLPLFSYSQSKTE